MHSNSSDVIVVDVADCGSGGGGSAQLRPDQYGGGVIGAAAESGGGSRISTAAAWIWRRGGRPMRERRPSTTGASMTVGVELCGRPVPVVIRRRASIC
jgi:hypothetical protein